MNCITRKMQNCVSLFLMSSVAISFFVCISWYLSPTKLHYCNAFTKRTVLFTNVHIYQFHYIMKYIFYWGTVTWCACAIICLDKRPQMYKLYWHTVCPVNTWRDLWVDKGCYKSWWVSLNLVQKWSLTGL